MLAASLVVISQGYLLPAKVTGQAIPHRLIDETYHSLQVAGLGGTAAH